MFCHSFDNYLKLKSYRAGSSDKYNHRYHRALSVYNKRLDIFQKKIGFKIPLSDDFLKHDGYKDGKFGCRLTYEASTIFILFHELAHIIDFFYFDKYGEKYSDKKLKNENHYKKIFKKRFSNYGFNFDYKETFIFDRFCYEPSLPIGIKREVRANVIQYILMTMFAGFKFSFDDYMKDSLTASPYVYDFTCITKDILDSNFLKFDITYEEYINEEKKLTDEQIHKLYDDEVMIDFLFHYSKSFFNTLKNETNEIQMIFPKLLKKWIDLSY